MCLSRLQLFLSNPVCLSGKKKKKSHFGTVKRAELWFLAIIYLCCFRNNFMYFPLYKLTFLSLKLVLAYYSFYLVAFIINFLALFHCRIILDIFSPFFSILHLSYTKFQKVFIFIFSHMINIQVCPLW